MNKIMQQKQKKITMKKGIKKPDLDLFKVSKKSNVEG